MIEMKYPKISIPKHCFIIAKPNANSPRIQLSPSAKHVKWLKKLREKAEVEARRDDLARSEEALVRMFWKTIRTVADKLLSGDVSIQVWTLRGEMSKKPGYREEAFDAAVDELMQEK